MLTHHNYASLKPAVIDMGAGDLAIALEGSQYQQISRYGVRLSLPDLYLFSLTLFTLCINAATGKAKPS